jgi:sigma-B regulation protein RsbU (phosphoserine phosphatase)
MFATALSVVADTRDRSVSVACAGHPLPVLLRQGKVVPFHVESTFPVLMMDLPSVPDVRHVLDPGDRLLFYTDGVTERHDPSDDMYDLPRLVAAFERTGSLPPQEQIQSIVDDLNAFAGDREPEDDQTLLLMALE